MDVGGKSNGNVGGKGLLGPTSRGGVFGLVEEAIGVCEQSVVGGEGKRRQVFELPIRECW